MVRAMSGSNQGLRVYLTALVGIAGVALLATLVSCGGSSTEVQLNSGVGAVRVSLSDPPSCRFPAGDFKNAYITVRSVMAHVSSNANDGSAGWQELAPQLATAPIQIDLLSTPQSSCILAQLGSATNIPVGSYQQIRLILVSNSPAAGAPVPATNACGSQGFNCVVLGDNSIHQLNLSSQDLTGLKIPPGQILGGPISVTEGQTIDLNIDFNVCTSVLLQGNGQYRLRPTLTAGQVSSVSTGINGQVVDATTQLPVAGGQSLVSIQQPDSTGTGRVVMLASADANGNFNFCPLPSGTYDIVAVATSGAGVAYDATAVLNVPAGSAVGKIPLVAETATPPLGPARIVGDVTSTTGSAGIAVDAAMSAFQSVTPSGGTARKLNIPLQGDSTLNVITETGGTCPANTFCKAYTLFVPASNPSFGVFAAGGTTFSTPATGDVLFSIGGIAFRPSSGGTQTCSPAEQTTDKDSADLPLKVTGGAAVTAKRLDFTGCS